MWDSLARGYKLAAVTLAVELAIALVLLSDTLAIFAMLAIPLVGVAWLPSSLMIFADLRQEQEARPVGYVIAVVCGIIGMACLYTFAKWTVMAMFVK